jgi:hypothetical protein
MARTGSGNELLIQLLSPVIVQSGEDQYQSPASSPDYKLVTPGKPQLAIPNHGGCDEI